MVRYRNSIIFVSIAILLLAAILNVIQFNKNKKTEFALYQVAMDFNLQQYSKIGAIQQTLTKAEGDKKLYVNDFRLREHFQQLSSTYTEMVIMYGTLNSYRDVSHIETNRLTDMLRDYAQYLSQFNTQDLPLAEDENGQYVQLTDRQVESIASIAQMMRELDHIRLGVGSSSDDIRSNWENIMRNNEAVSNSPIIANKHQQIVNEIRAMH